MLHRKMSTVFILLFIALPVVVAAMPRFPHPEFVSGYEVPTAQHPITRTIVWEIADVALLVLALSLITYLALRRRSRRGVMLTSLACLAYFGFYREGCVCAVGSLQNVTLAMADSSVAVPLTVLAFFLLPLAFTLLFGRTFCAGVCPLGAVQDLVILKPLAVPRALDKALRMVPVIYLTAAVLLAATGTTFLICRWDPFVAFFRLDGPSSIVLFGVILLLLGMIVARPYCRYLCPYGVLLGWMSFLSRWRVSITPSACIDCRLCEESCPFGSILQPSAGDAPGAAAGASRRLLALLMLLPVLVAAGVWVGHAAAAPLSRFDASVSMAHLLQKDEEHRTEEDTTRIDAFRASGTTEDALLARAASQQDRIHRGALWAGGFLGLVFGVQLLLLSWGKRRDAYEQDRTTCFSCGRCFEACPHDASHRLGPPAEGGER